VKIEPCELCDRNTTLLAGIPGPWSGEPNRVEFRHAGFPCVLHRGGMGAWCGYVGVPPGHPWHGKDYDDIDADAHGGLTYSGRCGGCVCHVPLPGESDDFWWVGFDCAHYNDLIPHMFAEELHSLRSGMVYKTIAFAKAETERLAEQAAAEL